MIDQHRVVHKIPKLVCLRERSKAHSASTVRYCPQKGIKSERKKITQIRNKLGEQVQSVGCCFVRSND